jgi:hypothetical protein
MGCFTGIYDAVLTKDNFFYVLTAILLNYTVWRFRTKKIVPSLATQCHEVDYLFNTVAVCSKKNIGLGLYLWYPFVQEMERARARARLGPLAPLHPNEEGPGQDHKQRGGPAAGQTGDS